MLLDFELDAPTVQASSQVTLEEAPSARKPRTMLGGFVSEAPPSTAAEGRAGATAVSIAPPPHPDFLPVATNFEGPAEDTRADLLRPRSVSPDPFANSPATQNQTLSVPPQDDTPHAPLSRAPQYSAPPAAANPQRSGHNGRTWLAAGSIVAAGIALLAAALWARSGRTTTPEYSAIVQVDSYGRNYIGLSCRNCAEGTAISLLRQSGEFHGRTASVVLPPLATCGLTRIPITFTPPGGSPLPWDADVEVPLSMRADLTRVSETPSTLSVVGCVADGVHATIEGNSWSGQALELPLTEPIVGAAEATQAIKKTIRYTVASRNGTAVQGEIQVTANVTPLRNLGPKMPANLRSKPVRTFILQTLPDAQASVEGQPMALDARGVFEVATPSEHPITLVRVVRAGMVARNLSLVP